MFKATILCGLPFSGKTYITARMRKLTNATVVSFDDIKHEISPLKIVMEEQDWRAVKSLALERYESALAAKENVIWDSTNPLKSHRTELAQLAKRYGAQETILYLNFQRETIYSRRERNIETPVRHQVEEKEFFKTLEVWEEPSDTEGNLVVLSSHEEVERFLSMLSSDN